MNATIITVNGSVTDFEINPEKSNLELLQGIVEGYIEFTYTEDNILVCNEEGLLIGLPINEEVKNRYGITVVGNVVVLPLEYAD